MDQVQCPNCKSYKVVMRDNVIIILGFCLGIPAFLFLFLFWPLGILLGIAALVMVFSASIKSMTGKNKTFVCQDCQYKFEKQVR